MGALVAAVGLAAGCGTKGDLAGGQVPVRGKVVGRDGKGVGPVALRFYPTQPGLVNGTAETGPDGAFTAKTTPIVEGLVPGSYKVTVSSLPTKGSAPVQVPAKYGDASSTDLVVQVASGQDVTVELK
jgi:hypothetical protein